MSHIYVHPISTINSLSCCLIRRKKQQIHAASTVAISMANLGLDSAAMADFSGSSSSSEPYPYAYHYTDHFLTTVEFSDGSFQVPYAYHYDVFSSRCYFAEFKDGSVIPATTFAKNSLGKLRNDDDVPFVPLRFTFSAESGCYDLDLDFPALEKPLFQNYEEDFPELRVNNVVQLVDASPERATHTSQGNLGCPETEEVKTEPKSTEGVEVSEEQGTCVSSSSDSPVLCMDRLREELSCAICLEICFEPSTTTCGHSFCKECLKSAADMCGTRCPKCRQLIGNRRAWTVNTVLWNTIQLVFPKETEARKGAGELNSGETELQLQQRRISYPSGRRSVDISWMDLLPSEDEDDDNEWAFQDREDSLMVGDDYESEWI